MEQILLVLLSGIVYAILSSVKNGFLKNSHFLKGNGESQNVYLTVLLEALISSIGLFIGILIVTSFTESDLPNLLTFGIGAFVCFFLVKLLFFKMQRKPAAK